MSDFEDRLAVEALLADLEEPDDIDGEWLTLPEAAHAAGVSRSALRQWYRSGQIPSQLVDGPHGPQRLVPRTAVLTRAAFSPPRPQSRPDLEAQVAELRGRVDALEAALRAR